MQTTNASNQTNPAISSARVPGAAHPKAAAVVSPPSGLALEGWGLASYDSSSDEEQGARPAGKSAAAKRAGKGCAASKDKYLVPAGKQQQQQQSGSPHGRDLMPGAGDDDLQLTPFDPFADAEGADAKDGGGGAGAAVHIRVQQRNGRKTLTTVQGLSAAYSYPRILRDLKRELCCNGVVVEDEELGSVIQLQGDHRKKVAAFLVKAGMVTKPNVKVHGF
ncbi:hypothetical protein BS78_06G238300 [Paspalum vaginatum]|nr:hypothetical protein BS78_06G238300 [Paspalum vaginatum]